MKYNKKKRDATVFSKIISLHLDELTLEKSIKLNNKLCYSISSLTINSNGETCLPADWQYLPLLTVLNRRMLPSRLIKRLQSFVVQYSSKLLGLNLTLVVSTVETNRDRDQERPSCRDQFLKLVEIFSTVEINFDFISVEIFKIETF
jgi:hypothetical protein